MSRDVLVFIQHTFYLFLLQGEVLREVVLNGGDDRLKFKFDEDDYSGSEMWHEKPRWKSGRQKY